MTAAEKKAGPVRRRTGIAAKAVLCTVIREFLQVYGILIVCAGVIVALGATLFGCVSRVRKLEKQISSMQEEFDLEIENVRPLAKERTVSIATGVAAYRFLSGLARRLEEKAKGLKINVYEIKNRTFGEKITVAGLLCGKDILKGLKGKELGDTLYISSSMLRDGENVLLDDVTTDQLAEALDVKIVAVDCDGAQLIRKLTTEGK